MWGGVPPLGGVSSSSMPDVMTPRHVVATPLGAPQVTGVPTCPSLAAKRLYKEYEEILHKGGMAAIPHCAGVTLVDEDIFHWIVSFAKDKATRANGTLIMQVLFPRNYPFSPPFVSCAEFTLFVPRFVVDWSPRLTVQKLLVAILSQIETMAFPINHLSLGDSSTEEVILDAEGLTATNHSNNKAILLCVKPAEPHERLYCCVHILKSTELDIGMTTLWDSCHRMKCVWSYLDVGVIQSIILPEGAPLPDGKREKLNAYEYAAEEMVSVKAQPFKEGDTVSIFYDGKNQSITFYHNGVTQHRFRKIFSATEGARPVDERPAVSRRSRRSRAVDNSTMEAELLSLASAIGSDDVNRSNSSAIDEYDEGSPMLFETPQSFDLAAAKGKKESLSSIYPAVSLGPHDSVSFSFEPPLWEPATHCFFPTWFGPVAVTALLSLRRRHGLAGELARSIVAWVGVGYRGIRIP